MKLTVGILRGEPGWELLLNQIGVDWKTVVASEDFDPEQFSTIILNTTPTSFQQKGLMDYMQAGGAVLATNGAWEGFARSKLKTRKFASLPPSAFNCFPAIDMVDIYSLGVVQTDDRRRDMRLPSFLQIEKGLLATIPFNIDRLFLDTRTVRKNFYFTTRRLASERTALVSKGALRRFITGILEHLHAQRDLPFAHKWYFPEGKRSLFTFRVDSDQGSPEEIDELYNLSARHSVQTMWFVDTKSHERWLNRFRRFEKQDVGIHCYEHLAYSAEEENFQNFARAQGLLLENGIHSIGAAAPYGTWNAAIANVYERLGVSFSSEFSLDYDDLPFSPHVQDRFSNVLQIPIHPICVGSMLRSGYTDREMKEYFRRLVDVKLAIGEAICIYHHPTHRRMDVIEETFEYIKARHIDNISFPEFAEWWKLRGQVRLEFEFRKESNSVHAVSSNAAIPIFWRIVTPDGKEAYSSQTGILPIASLAPREAPPPPGTPADIVRTRRFDFRHPIVDLLDSWYKRTQ